MRRFKLVVPFALDAVDVLLCAVAVLHRFQVRYAHRQQLALGPHTPIAVQRGFQNLAQSFVTFGERQFTLPNGFNQAVAVPSLGVA